MVAESAFKKYAWISIIVIMSLTAFLGYKATTIEFDYNFEKFFPVDDEETDFFLSYRKQFTSDNDFLLIAIENDKGVFDLPFLKEVDKVTKDLEKVNDVKFITSITNQSERFIFPGGQSSSKAYVNFDDFDPKRDSTRIFKNDELINTLVAKDAKSICIFLRHTDYISKKKSDALIGAVDKVLAKYKFDNTRVAGRTIGQRYYIEKMTFEMALFIGLSAVLIIVFLMLAFRSVWGVVIPQVIIFLSMTWVVGGMGLFHEPMNIILSTLPSIMFVVSMSDVIHLVSRYLDALREEPSPYEAIIVSVKEVGMATLLTSVTTAIGFFSLYFVNVQPIQAFGVVMGFGVLIAFVLTFAMLPVLFYFFPGPKYVRESKKEHFWKKHLAKGFIYVLHNRIKVVIVSSIILLISVFGMLQIESNNFLMDDLNPKEPLKVDFDYLDEHYGGIRPFELAVIITDSDTKVWDKDVLQTIDSVEYYLENSYGVSIKNSLIKMLKVINRSSHVGNKDYYKLETSKRKLKKQRKSLRLIQKGEFIKTFVDSTEKTTRINGTIPDLGNTIISDKNDDLNSFLESKTLNGRVKYQVTGTAHLIDKNLKYMSTSLVKGLAFSVLIVALIISLIYRSFPVLVISIITNLIPLVFIAGIMGYFGIVLKTSTSIVFTIAFGIAVDDTIHFLGKFKHELRKGKSKIYALKRTYLTTGKAMILTTLILCAGFMLLVFSSFLGTFYMGLLLCITLFVALIADITILPVLLFLFYHPKKKDKLN